MFGIIWIERGAPSSGKEVTATVLSRILVALVTALVTEVIRRLFDFLFG